MISFLTRNALVVVIAGVLIAGGIWYTFSGGSETETLVTESAGGTAESEVVDTLLALRAVSLSGTIFSDPAFKTLRDFGTQIVPEPIGRPNPFGPRQVGSVRGAQ